MLKQENKNRIRRFSWLAYDSAEAEFHNGTLTEQDWRTYLHLWHFGCPRYSSWPQEKFFLKWGGERLTERIERVRRVIRLAE